jgi:hypothetical protein
LKNQIYAPPAAPTQNENQPEIEQKLVAKNNLSNSQSFFEISMKPLPDFDFQFEEGIVGNKKIIE